MVSKFRKFMLVLLACGFLYAGSTTSGSAEPINGALDVPPAADDPQAAQVSSSAPPAATSAVQWHVLRFRLDMHSMKPATVSVPPGPYAIDVINGAVVAPITIQLSDSGANVLQQISGAASAARVRNLYTLAPGTYTIGVRSRPEWSATITVVKE